MKVYDVVKLVMQENEMARDSDKVLTWLVWEKMGYVQNGLITKRAYLSAVSDSSIRRAGRKIRELHPELRGSYEVEKERKKKEETKGTFIFREGA